jgi:hypothetical protein
MEREGEGARQRPEGDAPGAAAAGRGRAPSQVTDLGEERLRRFRRLAAARVAEAGIFRVD